MSKESRPCKRVKRHLHVYEVFCKWLNSDDVGVNLVLLSNTYPVLKVKQVYILLM